MKPTVEMFNAATLGATVGIIVTVGVVLVMLALFGGGRK